MACFFAASRAFIRKILRRREIDVDGSGPKLSLPLTITDEPQETRFGFYADDKSPFYEMNRTKLFGYYYGYKGHYERRHELLYADLIGFYDAKFAPVIDTHKLRVSDVEVYWRPVSFRLPTSLQEHSRCAVDFFKETKRLNQDAVTGAWENNRTIRLEDIEDMFRFICQPATYFDQVATNLTLDWNTGKLTGRYPTLRTGIERPQNGKLVPLSQSALANTFGTAVMFLSQDLQRYMLRVRADNMAAIPHSALHCSVSGVLEPEPDLSSGKYKFSFFEFGTHKEIKNETGLEQHEYNLWPIAFARELPRGGKPQLFFLAVLKVEDKIFHESCKNAAEAKEFIPVENETHKLLMEKLSSSRLETMTYEGFASLWLAEDFVEANVRAFD